MNENENTMCKLSRRVSESSIQKVITVKMYIREDKKAPNQFSDLTQQGSRKIKASQTESWKKQKRT